MKTYIATIKRTIVFPESISNDKHKCDTLYNKVINDDELIED